MTLEGGGWISIGSIDRVGRSVGRPYDLKPKEKPQAVGPAVENAEFKHQLLAAFGKLNHLESFLSADAL